MQAAADSPFGQACYLGDFRRREFLEVAEDHDFPIALGQFVYRRANRLGASAESKRLERISCRLVLDLGHVLLRDDYFIPCSRLADIHPVQIEENRIYPVVERTRRTEFVDSEDGAFKSAEDKIFGFMGIPAKKTGGSLKARTILRHQATCAHFTVSPNFFVDLHLLKNKCTKEKLCSRKI